MFLLHLMNDFLSFSVAQTDWLGGDSYYSNLEEGMFTDIKPLSSFTYCSYQPEATGL